MANSEKLYEEKVIKFKGARHYLIKMEGEEHFKHHRWDYPAIVPLSKNSEFKKGYFFSEDKLFFYIILTFPFIIGNKFRLCLTLRFKNR